MVHQVGGGYATRFMRWLTYRSKWLETLIEGSPMILIHDGKIDHRALKRVQMTIHELRGPCEMKAARPKKEERLAVLENNGHITVIRREHEPSAES